MPPIPTRGRSCGDLDDKACHRSKPGQPWLREDMSSDSLSELGATLFPERSGPILLDKVYYLLDSDLYLYKASLGTVLVSVFLCSLTHCSCPHRHPGASGMLHFASIEPLLGCPTQRASLPGRLLRTHGRWHCDPGLDPRDSSSPS